MGRKAVFGSILLAGLLALPAAHAEGEPVSRVELMVSNCLTCHGAKGQGAGEMPEITDIRERRFVATLQDYKADEDPDATVMNRHAAAYTDEQIKAIAEYIYNQLN